MGLRKIIEEKWSFTLYEDEDKKHFLSVLCGSVAMYEINILLTEDEIKLVSDKNLLLKLVDKIQYSPSIYTNRNIKLPI